MFISVLLRRIVKTSCRRIGFFYAGKFPNFKYLGKNEFSIILELQENMVAFAAYWRLDFGFWILDFGFWILYTYKLTI